MVAVVFRAMVAVVLAAGPAAAEPYVAGVGAGPRVTSASRDGFVGRVTASGARRWSDRWHLGVVVGLDASDGGNTLITEEVIEPGLLLRRSTRVEMLLGMRVGHAWFRMERNGGSLGVHAIVLESVIEVRVRVGATLDLRVAPLVPTVYRSGMWHVAVGPEIGVSWRL